MEHAFIKAQQSLSTSFEEGNVPVAAQSTRTITLPDTTDTAEMIKFSETNKQSGNYSADFIAKRLSNFRTSSLSKEVHKGKPFAGARSQKAIDSMRSVLTKDRRFRYARSHSMTHSLYSVLSNIRSGKLVALISGLGTMITSGQGLPTSVPRAAVRGSSNVFWGITQNRFISRHNMFSRISHFSGLLKRKIGKKPLLSATGKETDRVLPKSDLDPADLPSQEAYKSWFKRVFRVDRNGWSFWKRLKHRIFSPVPLRNTKQGGSDWSGEYEAGFSGVVDVLGDAVDISSASVSARTSIVSGSIGQFPSSKARFVRYINTALQGLANILPRNIMQPADALTKDAFYVDEFAEQLADTVLVNLRKKGTRVVDAQTGMPNEVGQEMWGGIMQLVNDFRLALKDGQVHDKDFEMYIRENIRKLSQIDEMNLKGYTEDEVVDITIKAYDNTKERQSELTLQQSVLKMAKPIERMGQRGDTGLFVLFPKTIINSFSMFAERIPVLGVLYDLTFSTLKRGKPTPLTIRRTIEKQIVGGGFYAVGKYVVDNYGDDHIRVDEDGNVLIDVPMDISEIEKLLISSYSDDPTMLEDMMNSYNDVYNTNFTDPIQWFKQEGVDKYIVEPDEKGRGSATIRAPRLGWISSLLMSSIAFEKGLRSFDHLPLTYVQEKDMVNRLIEGISNIGFGGNWLIGTQIGDVTVGDAMKTAGNVFKQGGAHELASSLAKLMALLDPDSTNKVGDVFDMLAVEMASSLSAFKGITSTTGEPFNVESDLAKDPRAVGGWEEFLESGNVISVSRILNKIYGDDHITNKLDGMGFPVVRTQRDFDLEKGFLMVEFDYELNFVEQMLEDAQVEVKPFLDNQVISGQDRGIRLYQYRNDKGVTAYEEIVKGMHEVVIPIKKKGVVVGRYNYETALKKFRDSAGKQLQSVIDAGMERGREMIKNGEDPLGGGTITDEKILAAMAAREMYHQKITAIRSTFKNVSVLNFKADGKTKKFKQGDKALHDVLVDSKTAELSSAAGLAEHFEIQTPISNMSNQELRDFINEGVEREYQYLIDVMGIK